MNLERIWAITLRNLYDTKHNWARIADMIVWPALNILLWGYMTLFLAQNNSQINYFLSNILAATILWSLFISIQQGVGFSFINDVWDRNIFNIFASPISNKEYFSGLMGLGIVKTGITAFGMTLICFAFFHYNFLTVGPILFLFFTNIVLTGWVIGIVSVALLMRYGSKAESIIWFLPFITQPFAAITYPLSLMPHWMQVISFILPITHVFEGLRALVLQNRVDYRELVLSFGLNAVFFIAAVWFFSRVFLAVKEKGLLAKLV